MGRCPREKPSPSADPRRSCGKGVDEDGLGIDAGQRPHAHAKDSGMQRAPPIQDGGTLAPPGSSLHRSTSNTLAVRAVAENARRCYNSQSSHGAGEQASSTRTFGHPPLAPSPHDLHPGRGRAGPEVKSNPGAALREGRPFPPGPTWGLVGSLPADAVSLIWEDVLASPHPNPNGILETLLEAVVHQRADASVVLQTEAK
jgi:hypothetical protein